MKRGKKNDTEWELLYERAEDYVMNKVFKGVAVITAGVDIQADRIEVEIVGWMKGKRSQHIDYRVLTGATTKDEAWQQLDKVLNELFEREDGTYLPIRLMAVDSGYNAAKVYDWTNKTASPVNFNKRAGSFRHLFRRHVRLTTSTVKIGKSEGGASVNCGD